MSRSQSSQGPESVSLGKLVRAVVEKDVSKLDVLVAFKESEETWLRIQEIAKHQRRNVSTVARMIFRVGLSAIEGAIQGGIIR